MMTKPTLADATLRHLRAMADVPDLSATKYRIVRALGRGGMGTVYLVDDVELDRQVALKVVGLGETPAADAERLAGEAKILARLEHGGIVPVHDVGILPDGRAYYAMKFVRGDRLDAHLAHGLTTASALQVFERICDAVAFAHARGVIHRDLKIENVMVGPFGEVLVMDWGVAAISGVAASPAIVVGTPGYMAPEQAVGEPADERSDVYALGIVLQRMLGPGAPRPLRAISHKASASEPRERYQSVVALAADLARYREGLPVTAYPESMVERAARIIGRYRVPLALVLAYVVMRIVLALFAGP